MFRDQTSAGRNKVTSLFSSSACVESFYLQKSTFLNERVKTSVAARCVSVVRLLETNSRKTNLSFELDGQILARPPRTILKLNTATFWTRLCMRFPALALPGVNKHV